MTDYRHLLEVKNRTISRIAEDICKYQEKIDKKMRRIDHIQELCKHPTTETKNGITYCSNCGAIWEPDKQPEQPKPDKPDDTKNESNVEISGEIILEEKKEG